jgi:hypothetical protein
MDKCFDLDTLDNQPCGMIIREQRSKAAMSAPCPSSRQNLRGEIAPVPGANIKVIECELRCNGNYTEFIWLEMSTVTVGTRWERDDPGGCQRRIGEIHGPTSKDVIELIEFKGTYESGTQVILCQFDLRQFDGHPWSDMGDTVFTRFVPVADVHAQFPSRHPDPRSTWKTSQAPSNGFIPIGMCSLNNCQSVAMPRVTQLTEKCRDCACSKSVIQPLGILPENGQFRY